MTDTLILVWEGQNFVSSINTSTSSTYQLIGTNMTVDWGDGTTGTITSNQRFTHTYANSGTYTIIITGDSITSLGISCFSNCTGLKSITIPSSITSLGKYCLYSCTDLTSIFFTRPTPSTASTSNAFYDLPTSCKIYVPEGSLSAYTSASNYPSSSTYTYIERDMIEMEKAQVIAREIFNKLYPVGAIYMTVSEENPAKLFGGAWEQIEERFLLGAGDTYNANATGGEINHTLTVNEIPVHNHQTYRWNTIVSKNGNTGNLAFNSGKVFIPAGNASDFSSRSTESSGGNQAHNNMPPYLVVYIWERVA